MRVPATRQHTPQRLGCRSVLFAHLLERCFVLLFELHLVNFLRSGHGHVILRNFIFVFLRLAL